MSHMYSLLDLLRNPWLPFFAALAVGGGVWVLNKIFPAFLTYRYNALLELKKREMLQRDNATVISDLIVLLRRPLLSDEDKEKMDKLLLDLCLYLPPCLVHKLAHTVCRSRQKEDLGPLGFFVEVRSFIDGKYKPDKSKKLVAENIPLTVRTKHPYQILFELLSSSERTQIENHDRELELAVHTASQSNPLGAAKNDQSKPAV